jgi:hypothetical protein
MIKYKPTQNNPVLKAGEHVATVKLANEGFSAKGDQTIELELTVGCYTMRDTLYNSERASWRIKQARACFGFDDSEGEEIEFEAADLIGCTGKVRIDYGEPKKSGKYEGKSFLEVKEYLSRAESIEIEPMPDNIPF